MTAQQDGLGILPEVDGVEVIQKTGIFSKLGFDETSRLAAIMHIEHFEKGKIVVEQDSLGQALYIVRHGSVTVFGRDAGGNRERLDQLGPGELFGEMSLVDDLLASADVEVTSDTAELVVIPRNLFEPLIEADDRLRAKVYKSFCRTLGDRVRRQNIRLAEMERIHPAR